MSRPSPRWSVLEAALPFLRPTRGVAFSALLVASVAILLVPIQATCPGTAEPSCTATSPDCTYSFDDFDQFPASLPLLAGAPRPVSGTLKFLGPFVQLSVPDGTGDGYFTTVIRPTGSLMGLDTTPFAIWEGDCFGPGCDTVPYQNGSCVPDSPPRFRGGSVLLKRDAAHSSSSGPYSSDTFQRLGPNSFLGRTVVIYDDEAPCDIFTYGVVAIAPPNPVGLISLGNARYPTIIEASATKDGFSFWAYGYREFVDRVAAVDADVVINFFVTGIPDGSTTITASIFPSTDGTPSGGSSGTVIFSSAPVAVVDGTASGRFTVSEYGLLGYGHSFLLGRVITIFHSVAGGADGVAPNRLNGVWGVHTEGAPGDCQPLLPSVPTTHAMVVLNPHPQRKVANELVSGFLDIYLRSDGNIAIRYGLELRGVATIATIGSMRLRLRGDLDTTSGSDRTISDFFVVVNDAESPFHNVVQAVNGGTVWGELLDVTGRLKLWGNDRIIGRSLVVYDVNSDELAYGIASPLLDGATIDDDTLEFYPVVGTCYIPGAGVLKLTQLSPEPSSTPNMEFSYSLPGLNSAESYTLRVYSLGSDHTLGDPFPSSSSYEIGSVMGPLTAGTFPNSNKFRFHGKNDLTGRTLAIFTAGGMVGSCTVGILEENVQYIDSVQEATCAVSPLDNSAITGTLTITQAQGGVQVQSSGISGEHTVEFRTLANTFGLGSVASLGPVLATSSLLVGPSQTNASGVFLNGDPSIVGRAAVVYQAGSPVGTCAVGASQTGSLVRSTSSVDATEISCTFEGAAFGFVHGVLRDDGFGQEEIAWRLFAANVGAHTYHLEYMRPGKEPLQLLSSVATSNSAVRALWVTDAQAARDLPFSGSNGMAGRTLRFARLGDSSVATQCVLGIGALAATPGSTPATTAPSSQGRVISAEVFFSRNSVPTDVVEGYVRAYPAEGGVTIDYVLANLVAGLHSFAVFEFADLSDTGIDLYAGEEFFPSISFGGSSAVGSVFVPLLGFDGRHNVLGRTLALKNAAGTVVGRGVVGILRAAPSGSDVYETQIASATCSVSPAIHSDTAADKITADLGFTGTTLQYTVTGSVESRDARFPVNVSVHELGSLWSWDDADSVGPRLPFPPATFGEPDSSGVPLSGSLPYDLASVGGPENLLGRSVLTKNTKDGSIHLSGLGVIGIGSEQNVQYQRRVAKATCEPRATRSATGVALAGFGGLGGLISFVQTRTVLNVTLSVSGVASGAALELQVQRFAPSLELDGEILGGLCDRVPCRPQYNQVGFLAGANVSFPEVAGAINAEFVDLAALLNGPRSILGRRLVLVKSDTKEVVGDCIIGIADTVVEQAVAPQARALPAPEVAVSTECLLRGAAGTASQDAYGWASLTPDPATALFWAFEVRLFGADGAVGEVSVSIHDGAVTEAEKYTNGLGLKAYSFNGVAIASFPNRLSVGSVPAKALVGRTLAIRDGPALVASCVFGVASDASTPVVPVTTAAPAPLPANGPFDASSVFFKLGGKHPLGRVSFKASDAALLGQYEFGLESSGLAAGTYVAHLHENGAGASLGATGRRLAANVFSITVDSRNLYGSGTFSIPTLVLFGSDTILGRALVLEDSSNQVVGIASVLRASALSRTDSDISRSYRVTEVSCEMLPVVRYGSTAQGSIQLSQPLGSSQVGVTFSMSGLPTVAGFWKLSLTQSGDLSSPGTASAMGSLADLLKGNLQVTGGAVSGSFSLPAGTGLTDIAFEGVRDIVGRGIVLVDPNDLKIAQCGVAIKQEAVTYVPKISSATCALLPFYPLANAGNPVSGDVSFSLDGSPGVLVQAGIHNLNPSSAYKLRVRELGSLFMEDASAAGPVFTGPEGQTWGELNAGAALTSNSGGSITGVPGSFRESGAGLNGDASIIGRTLIVYDGAETAIAHCVVGLAEPLIEQQAAPEVRGPNLHLANSAECRFVPLTTFSYVPGPVSTLPPTSTMIFTTVTSTVVTTTAAPATTSAPPTTTVLPATTNASAFDPNATTPIGTTAAPSTSAPPTTTLAPTTTTGAPTTTGVPTTTPVPTPAPKDRVRQFVGHARISFDGETLMYVSGLPYSAGGYRLEFAHHADFALSRPNAIPIGTFGSMYASGVLRATYNLSESVPFSVRSGLIGRSLVLVRVADSQEVAGCVLGAGSVTDAKAPVSPVAKPDLSGFAVSSVEASLRPISIGHHISEGIVTARHAADAGTALELSFLLSGLRKDTDYSLQVYSMGDLSDLQLTAIGNAVTAPVQVTTNALGVVWADVAGDTSMFPLTGASGVRGRAVVLRETGSNEAVLAGVFGVTGENRALGVETSPSIDALRCTFEALPPAWTEPETEPEKLFGYLSFAEWAGRDFTRIFATMDNFKRAQRPWRLSSAQSFFNRDTIMGTAFVGSVGRGGGLEVGDLDGGNPLDLRPSSALCRSNGRCTTNVDDAFIKTTNASAADNLLGRSVFVYGSGGNAVAGCVLGLALPLPEPTPAPTPSPTPVPTPAFCLDSLEAKIPNSVPASKECPDNVYTCTVDCQSGYKLNSTAPVICDAGEWTGIPSCLGQPCSTAGIVHNGSDFATACNNTAHNAECTPTCEGEFYIEEASRCVAAEWVHVGQCIPNPTPAPTPVPTPAHCDPSEIETLIPNSRRLSCSSVYECTVGCVSGYHPVGNTVLGCFAGNWTGLPTCAGDSCPTAGVFHNNSQFLTECDNTDHNATCTPTCNDPRFKVFDPLRCFAGAWVDKDNLAPCLPIPTPAPTPVPTTVAVAAPTGTTDKGDGGGAAATELIPGVPTAGVAGGAAFLILVIAGVLFCLNRRQRLSRRNSRNEYASDPFGTRATSGSIAARNLALATGNTAGYVGSGPAGADPATSGRLSVAAGSPAPSTALPSQSTSSASGSGYVAKAPPSGPPGPPPRRPMQELMSMPAGHVAAPAAGRMAPPGPPPPQSAATLPPPMARSGMPGSSGRRYEIGDEVMAQYADDGQWYHAQVSASLPDGNYRCHYTEYGNDEIVRPEMVRPLQLS